MVKVAQNLAMVVAVFVAVVVAMVVDFSILKICPLTCLKETSERAIV